MKKIASDVFCLAELAQLFIFYLIFQQLYCDEIGSWENYIFSITTELVA